MSRASLSVFLAALFIVVPATQALAWTIGIVDTSDGDSPSSSLNVSLKGHTFVTWQESGGDDLWRARWNGSTWVETQVGGAGTFVGCYSSITDGYDYGPASGFKPTDGRERIASACIDVLDEPAPIKWTSYSLSQHKWVTRTIAYAPQNSGTASPVTNLDLAFDPDNAQPSIALGDMGERAVAWVHYDGTEWVDQTVADYGPGSGGDGPVVSIAFDPSNGEPAIAWNTSRFSGTLVFATYSDETGQWTSTPLSSGVYGVPSLAFAPDGTPWIAYQNGSETASTLDVAVLVNGSWSASTVDGSSTVTGFSPSIAFKGSLPRIAYHDQTNGNLLWAAFSGSSWIRSTLESTNDVGEYPSVAFTASGRPRISYYDRTKKDIRWIRAT